MSSAAAVTQVAELHRGAEIALLAQVVRDYQEATTAAEPRWYAASTLPRHEKAARRYLCDGGVNTFLPVYQAVHVWSDRKKVVELPLFPGYLFVRISREDRGQVLRAPGVLQFVTFQGAPAAVPDDEIDALRNGCATGVPFRPHPMLKSGTRVRVKTGCLAGAEGVLVRRKQSFRFVLSIELLNRAVSVEMDISNLEPLR